MRMEIEITKPAGTEDVEISIHASGFGRYHNCAAEFRCFDREDAYQLIRRFDRMTMNHILMRANRFWQGTVKVKDRFSTEILPEIDWELM